MICTILIKGTTFRGFLFTSLYNETLLNWANVIEIGTKSLVLDLNKGATLQIGELPPLILYQFTLSKFRFRKVFLIRVSKQLVTKIAFLWQKWRKIIHVYLFASRHVLSWGVWRWRVLWRRPPGHRNLWQRSS